MSEDDGVGHLAYVGVLARADQLPALRHALIDWAHHLGLPDEQVEAMALATYEALANSVAHAYPTPPAQSICTPTTFRAPTG